MILKSYQLNKIDIKKCIHFVLRKKYWAKIDAINFLKEKISNNFLIYDEKQILENSELFFDNIFSGSLFENKKML